MGGAIRQRGTTRYGQRGRLEQLTPRRMIQNYIFEIIRAIKNTILIFNSFTIKKSSKEKNRTSAFVNLNSMKLSYDHDSYDHDSYDLSFQESPSRTIMIFADRFYGRSLLCTIKDNFAL